MGGAGSFLQRTSRQIAGRPTRSWAEFNGWSVPLQGGKRPDVLVLTLCKRRSRYSGLLFWLEEQSRRFVHARPFLISFASHHLWVSTRLSLAVFYPWPGLWLENAILASTRPSRPWCAVQARCFYLVGNSTTRSQLGLSQHILHDTRHIHLLSKSLKQHCLRP